jgi:alpha-1,2-mannosyltransferase
VTTGGGRGWLTRKRLLTHGLLLGLALWSVYLWTLATPGFRDRNGNFKGTDFLHFYTLGLVAVEHRASDLYDMQAQSALVAQHVPQAVGIPYLPMYPPQVSLLFAPLAHLSYRQALAAWWAISGLIYAGCCFCVWRVCPQLRDQGSTVAVIAFAFPGFFNLIAWGQTSALALACFAGIYFLLRERREVLAGLILGCLIFKPQLALASVIVFTAIGAWRIIAGAAISSAIQLSIGALYFGRDSLRSWVAALSDVSATLPWLEPKPYQTHCLRTFWSMILPWHGAVAVLYVLSAVLILGLTFALWRQQGEVPLSLRYPALLLATVLVAPHLTVYDLVILAPAFLLLADWLIGREQSGASRRIGTALYFVYALPLLGPLTRWTHVQLSVVAMSWLLYLIVRISRGQLKEVRTDAMPV